MTEPYRPSNGTEGDCFMAKWCAHCANEPFDLEADDGCKILADTMAFDIDDPEYPKELVQDERGPRCTAFEERDDGVRRVHVHPDQIPLL